MIVSLFHTIGDYRFLRMLSPSLYNELIEILANNLRPGEIDEIGKLLFKASYDSNKLAGTNSHISLSSRKSAKILTEYCKQQNKLFSLIKLTVELDDGILLGRHIKIDGIETFLNKLAHEGYVYDFYRRKVIKQSADVSENINWGSLRDGKVYEVTVMSLDIVGNSALVKKYGIRRMEKIYFSLWQFLKTKLKDYNGRIWSWAGDGGIIAFAFKEHTVRAVLFALEIQKLIPIFNVRFNSDLSDRIILRIALDTGRLRFFSDTGRIISEVINYAAHLEKKATKPGNISLSGKLFSILPPNVSRYFTPGGLYEGNDFYTTCCRLDLMFPDSAIDVGAKSESTRFDDEETDSRNKNLA